MSARVAGQHEAAAVHVPGLLGLGDRVDYLPEKLPGGQKQRVAIAQAFVANPQVVFADEPTAALDRASGRQVVRLLKAMGQARETATIMVTHDSRTLDLADTVIDMEDGRIKPCALCPNAQSRGAWRTGKLKRQFFSIRYPASS